MTEERFRTYFTARPFGVAPYPVDVKKLEIEVAKAVSDVTLQFGQWREAMVRSQLYAKCKHCGEFIPIADVRLVEDMAELALAVEADKDDGAFKLTLRSRVCELVCVKCLEKGVAP